MIHRIPEELREYAQWVCWRIVKRKEKGRVKKIRKNYITFAKIRLIEQAFLIMKKNITLNTQI